MTKNIQEAFDFFDRDNSTNLKVQVKRIAVTPEQIEKWKLPDTQLEAIRPDELLQLVKDSVETFIDKDKYEEILAKIKEGREEVGQYLANINYGTP